MRALLAVLLGALMGVGSACAAELTSQQLAAKAQDSLVFIATRYFDENTSQTKAAGSGSGVVITASGLVLTAYHVVKDWNAQSDEDKANNPLRVRLGSSHGDEVDAQIVGVNEQYDVALLRILRPGTYKASGVCFADTLSDGEAVTGFGFPDGLERQSSPGTFGNASADNGRWAVSFNNAEGMSGGPLYDAFGDVVSAVDGHSTLDDSVRAAAGIARAYLRSHDRVGIVSLGGKLRWLTPGTGSTHLLRIVESVLDVRRDMGYQVPDLDRVPPPALPAGALVYAITPLADDRFLEAAE